MKTLIQTSLKLAFVSLLIVLGSALTRAQDAKLQLDQLDSLANKASETVDVRLDERLIQMTTKWLGNDADDQKVKDVIKGVKGIYVRSFSFEKEGEYTRAEVDSIMTQLRGSAWSKIVAVKSRKVGDNVEVYLHTIGGQIGGLVVVSIDPKEFTVVNIVGPIDLDKLSDLEGQFGVPDLGIESSKPKKNKSKEDQ